MTVPSSTSWQTTRNQRLRHFTIQNKCIFFRTENGYLYLQSRKMTAGMENFQGRDANMPLLGHLSIPCTCWIKHLSHAQGNGNERACVCRDETPYPSLCPREFSLDAFYTSPKTCIDKLSVTCGESGNGCGENQSSPLLFALNTSRANKQA